MGRFFVVRVHAVDEPGQGTACWGGGGVRVCACVCVVYGRVCQCVCVRVCACVCVVLEGKWRNRREKGTTITLCGTCATALHPFLLSPSLHVAFSLGKSLQLYQRYFLYSLRIYYIDHDGERFRKNKSKAQLELLGLFFTSASSFSVCARVPTAHRQVSLAKGT